MSDDLKAALELLNEALKREYPDGGVFEVALGVVTPQQLAALPGERSTSVYDGKAPYCIDGVRFKVGALAVRAQAPGRPASPKEIEALTGVAPFSLMRATTVEAKA